MQDINKFSEKLKEAKFSEFSTLSTKQIEELDEVLNVEIPKLIEVGSAIHKFKRIELAEIG